MNAREAAERLESRLMPSVIVATAGPINPTSPMPAPQGPPQGPGDPPIDKPNTPIGPVVPAFAVSYFQTEV